MLDQVDVDSVSALGEAATRLALPELRKAASWQARLRRMATQMQLKRDLKEFTRQTNVRLIGGALRFCSLE